MSQSEAQSVALVTGASGGLGKEVARQLAEQGVHAVIASRDPADGEDRRGARRLCFEGGLDVTDAESVRAAADERRTIPAASTFSSITQPPTSTGRRWAARLTSTPRRQ